MNLTQKEIEMLDKIAHDDYQPVNGATPEYFEETDAVWAWSVSESKSDGGVISSLIKKGLIKFQEGETKDDDVIWLTKEGFAIWWESK